MPANVFVLGLDELNLETLHHLPSEEYAFHPLLTKDELVNQEKIDLARLLERAQRQLEAFDGSVDAIIGYWDFPVSSMVPILCRRFGLFSAGLESVVKCEDKYWSRLEQKKAIDEVPEFAIIHLDDHDEHDELPANLRYPVWLKPVKSTSSELAFRVENDDEFASALAAMREGIGKFANPFEFVLDQLDLPDEIADVGATACLAEEAVGGRQVTVEGYRAGGDVQVYGIIDSLSYPETSSFLRYQYPASIPRSVRKRLIRCSVRVIEQVGLDWTTFNIEYFWDADKNRIRLLEVNPRHSQSHAIMFEQVDGRSNHELMIKLALGRKPDHPYGAGEYDVASKWFLRSFEDGVVTRSPAPDEVERIQQHLDGVTVHLVAEEGQRLSELPHQDTYSFELAQVFVGAHDEAELVDKYEECVRLLAFEIEK